MSDSRVVLGGLADMNDVRRRCNGKTIFGVSVKVLVGITTFISVNNVYSR